MQINKFDALQTFYIDPVAVNNASEVYLTSVEIFFKRKPQQNVTTTTQSDKPVQDANVTPRSVSSIFKPGVIVSICDVENELPVLTQVYDASLTRKEYDSIYDFGDASVSSPFVFSKPLLLKTGKFYGIVVQFDDVGFELWTNKQGDRLIGTNIPSPGINSAKDGKFFNGATNPSTLTPLTNIDLKYKVNVAKFTANTLNVELVNKDYEFLTINTISGTFIGGEYVFKLGSNATGNVAVTLGNNVIVGTNTDFSQLHSGDKIVILGPNAESNGTVLTVSAVISNTRLETTTAPLFSNSAAKYIADVVAKVYSYNAVDKKLYLYESSANTAKYLAANDNIVGTYSKATSKIQSVDDFSVDRIVPMIKITNPSIGTYTGTYNFSYSNGSAYIIDSTKERNISTSSVNDLSKYDGYVLSRSNEVLNSFIYDNVARKSAVTKLSFNINAPTSKLFTSPSIDENEIDFFVHQSNVNNSHTVTISGVEYDTEVGKNGTASSKHITKKVTFANNRFAEDVRVFASVYRPVNTDVIIYAKLHNSSDLESFDDKSWTPLEVIENDGRYSSSENKYDYIEYTYGLPNYPETANTLPGTFKVDSGNSIVVGSGVVVNNYVLPGDVVRIYNPLESETDYFVAGVSASNTTTMTINITTANASVLGLGMKIDKVKYKNICFNDPQNDGVCAYFNNSLSKVDQFDTMQFKIVFLANTTNYIPRVDSLSVVGVSA